MIISRLKSSILAGADGFNALIGGPQPFNRMAVLDPSTTFPDAMARRDAIAASAEAELLAFVSNGVFSQSTPNDMGDMGIWQGVFTAMAVLRWRAKNTPENAELMLAASSAMARYFYNGIILRGAAPTSLEGTMFHVDVANTKQYFADDACTYRDGASLDSMLGLLFGAAIVNRFGDTASKATIAVPLGVFSAAFTKAGFNIVDRTGAVTAYGACAPGFLQAPVRTLAATLPSLVAGTETWKSIAASHAPEFSVTDTQAPGNISWVNVNLAVLANLTYACAAPAGAPGLIEATAGLRSLLNKYSYSGNAFLIYAAALLGVTPTQTQIDIADKVLIEFPVGPKPRESFNTSVAPSMQPVPVWQRPPVDVIWQRSPYTYSGSDDTAYNRFDYLLAHYFQRGNK